NASGNVRTGADVTRKNGVSMGVDGAEGHKVVGACYTEGGHAVGFAHRWESSNSCEKKKGPELHYQVHCTSGAISESDKIPRISPKHGSAAQQESATNCTL